jgi:hypothetical protein
LGNPYQSIFQRVCEIIDDDIMECDFSCKQLAEICETTPRQIGAAFKNDQFVAGLFERGLLVDVAPDYGWKAGGRQTFIAISRAE